MKGCNEREREKKKISTQKRTYIKRKQKYIRNVNNSRENQ